MKFKLLGILLSSILLTSVAHSESYIDCSTLSQDRLAKLTLSQLCVSHEPSGSPKKTDTGLIADYGLTTYAWPLLASAKQPQFRKHIKSYIINEPKSGGPQNYGVDIFYVKNNDFSPLNKHLFGNDFQYMHVDLINYPIHGSINEKVSARREAYREYIWLASLQTYLDHHHTKGALRIDVDKVRTMMRAAMLADMKKSESKILTELGCMLNTGFFQNPIFFLRMVYANQFTNMNNYSVGIMKDLSDARKCRIN